MLIQQVIQTGPRQGLHHHSDLRHLDHLVDADKMRMGEVAQQLTFPAKQEFLAPFGYPVRADHLHDAPRLAPVLQAS